MLPNFLDRASIPHKPGIYIHKDEKGQILYVGKAVDLFHRVSSYFSGRIDSPKTAALVSKIRAVETIVVESELEALILEANLIKKHLPLYNIRLTDDKDYLYIAITKEIYPKVITARKKDLKPIKEWFGPFPSGSTVKSTLKQLRRVFPWCSSPPKAKISNFKFQIPNSRKRACFYYHLKLCPGACVGVISKEDYNKIVKRFSKFMNGKKEELVRELESEMKALSDEQKFEEAKKVKNQISNIEYLTQPNRVTSYLENKNFLEDENNQAILELQKVLKLPELPERIEAYDISNISGTNATGSMVVLTNGEIDKSQYRRFKIKTTSKSNDYAMHGEMMRRRLNHPEWPYPQLFIIDGGRGQVRAVKEVIKSRVWSLESGENVIASEAKQSTSLNQLTNIPIYGLAKRFEWLYPPEGEVIKLPRRSLALRLLQKIRNESHRFAINYHKKLRSKSFFSS